MHLRESGIAGDGRVPPGASFDRDLRSMAQVPGPAALEAAFIAVPAGGAQ